MGVVTSYMESHKSKVVPQSPPGICHWQLSKLKEEGNVMWVSVGLSERGVEDDLGAMDFS